MIFSNESNITYLHRYTKEGIAILNQVSVINLFYLLLSSILLIRGYRNSTTQKLKKQITFILITLIVSVLITFIDYGILFEFSPDPDVKRIPGLATSYTLIWIFGIGYALVKYRLLTLDITTINQHIIANIDEMVVLVNPDFQIMLVNHKLKETIQSAENLHGKHISSLVQESEPIINELKAHPENNETSISCHMHLKYQENHRICANAKIKKIRDKFKDIIGYLIIAKKLNGLRQLQDIYKITTREAGIIQAVIAGRANYDIAEELGITERTVKSHMTHIFNKLNVNSRVQLLIKLKDFQLIPEGETDKIMFSKEEPPE